MIVGTLYILYLVSGLYQIAGIELDKAYKKRPALREPHIVRKIRRFIIARHAVSGMDGGKGGGFAATNKS